GRVKCFVTSRLLEVQHGYEEERGEGTVLAGSGESAAAERLVNSSVLCRRRRIGAVVLRLAKATAGSTRASRPARYDKPCGASRGQQPRVHSAGADREPASTGSDPPARLPSARDRPIRCG